MPTYKTVSGSLVKVLGLEYLLVLFVILNLLVLSVLGPKYVNDSHRFVGYAADLKQGFYIDPHNVWYGTYVLFLWVIGYISSSYWAIVVAQCMLSVVALACIYRSALLLFQDVRVAVVAGLFFLVFIEISFWNAYLLAESLFISLTAINFYLLIQYWYSKEQKHLIYFLTLLPFTFFCKPTGVVFLLASLTVLAFCIFRKINKMYAVGITFLAFMLVMVLVQFQLKTFVLIENYAQGDVVYGFHTLAGKFSNPANILWVPPPHELFIPDHQKSNLIRLVEFIWHNPAYFGELAFKKVILFVTHVRPYWSSLHNTYNIMILLVMYLGLALYFLKVKSQTFVKVFATSFLMLSTFTIGLTSVDWDGRFFMPLWPVMCVLGAGGWQRFIKWEAKHQAVV